MSIIGQLTIRRHREEDAEMDITPMIDITFLLLAFFVVVSKMDPKKNVKLPISEVASNIPEKDCVMIYIDVTGAEDDGTIFIGSKGDRKIEGSEEEIADQIRDYVDATLLADQSLEYIMIKAHGDSKNGLVERVKIAAASAESVGDRQLLVGVENKKLK